MERFVSVFLLFFYFRNTLFLLLCQLKKLLIRQTCFSIISEGCIGFIMTCAATIFPTRWTVKTISSFTTNNKKCDCSPPTRSYSHRLKQNSIFKLIKLTKRIKKNILLRESNAILSLRSDSRLPTEYISYTFFTT